VRDQFVFISFLFLFNDKCEEKGKEKGKENKKESVGNGYNVSLLLYLGVTYGKRTTIRREEKKEG
jgi:hypothetical protein